MISFGSIRSGMNTSMSSHSNYPKDAYHNKEGMFVSPDPDTSEAVFTQVGSLWLPKPTTKSVTRIAFEHATLFVEEDIDTVQARIDEGLATTTKADWIEFTDPTFGTKLRVPTIALANLVTIVEDWWDMENEKLKMRQAEYQKKIATEQLGRASFELAAHTSKRHRVR